MAEKEVKGDEIPLVIGRKRGERPRSSSSPETPATKTDLSSIWIALNRIQRNTNELLKENRALRTQYDDLQKSLEFHISQVEKLETENKALKKEASSLKDQIADLEIV